LLAGRRVRDSEPAGRRDRARPGQLSQHGRLDRPKLRWPSARTHRERAAGGVYFPWVLRPAGDGQASARGAPYDLVHRSLKSCSRRSNRSTATLCSNRLNRLMIPAVRESYSEASRTAFGSEFLEESPFGENSAAVQR